MDKSQRTVRVFISSTFRDMFAEREVLVKFTFPELRKRCRERHVEFTDVDLRWGITDEQKAEGKVLPICLAEIERCQPYFIGILGERYGWVPEEFDEELVKTQKWLEEHRKKSVTELEMIHGVLQVPAMEKLAYFYFRDPLKSEEVEKELKRQPDYVLEPEASKKKLTSLKQQIEKSGYPIYKNYPDAKALGQRVLDDLWTAIDQRFPEEEIPSALERERMEHEAFAEARRKVYIGREEYFERLDKHVKSEDPPLVILGESGSGKSALIANWVKRYRESHPDDFMVLHFTGSTPFSADNIFIMRRIMEEIKVWIESEKGEDKPNIPSLSMEGREEEIPNEPQKLVEQFPIWLAKAAAKGKLILILDGLNHVEDSNNAPDLGWLPEYFPPNIKVILSMLPGRTLDALKKRQLETLNVQPIKSTEKEQLINDYLEQYSRKLDNVYIRRIVKSEQSANPLYLKILLEELKVFGIHEQLKNKIEYYLTAKTVDGLFTLVLERLETDYEREDDHKGLVKNVMSLIWASRRGLSETELLDLLGSDKHPLLQAYWSPLYLALEESLVIRSGLLNFFHDFLRKAVEDRYLNNDKLKRMQHLSLAAYFEKKELDERKADELLWQLHAAEEWARLKECIVSPKIFLTFVSAKKLLELTGYWIDLEGYYNLVESYYTAIENNDYQQLPDDQFLHFLDGIAIFFRINARYKAAVSIYKRALSIAESNYGAEDVEVGIRLNNLACSLNELKSDSEAVKLYRRALTIDHHTYGSDNEWTAKLLNNLAVSLSELDEIVEAEMNLRRALAINEKLNGPHHPNVADNLRVLSFLCGVTARYEAAETYYRKALKIDKITYGFNHPLIAMDLLDIATLLTRMERYSESNLICRQALDINERLLGPKHPAVADCLFCLGMILWKTNCYDEAEMNFRRAIGILNHIYGPDDVRTDGFRYIFAVFLFDLINKGLRDSEKLNSEDKLIQELDSFLKDNEWSKEAVVQIVENFFSFKAVTSVLNKNINNQAVTHYKIGDDKAIDRGKKILIEDQITIATNLNNLAIALYNKGNYDEAEPLYRQALEIRKKVLGEEHIDTATSQNNLALLLIAKGVYEEAELLYTNVLSLRERDLGKEHPDTAISLYNLGYLFYAKGNGTLAVTFYQRALDIYEKIVDPSKETNPQLLSTIAICHNQVAFHNYVPNKNWKKAEEHYLKSMELFRKTSNQTEAINAELNLQIMYNKSGQKFDIERIQEITRLLEEAGDKKAEKGQKVLKELL